MLYHRCQKIFSARLALTSGRGATYRPSADGLDDGRRWQYNARLL